VTNPATTILVPVVNLFRFPIFARKTPRKNKKPYVTPTEIWKALSITIGGTNKKERIGSRTAGMGAIP